MTFKELQDHLEVCFLEAKDRGDRRGEVMALLGLVEVHMTESLDVLTRQLLEWPGELPLKAEGHWRLDGPKGRGIPRGTHLLRVSALEEP